MTKLTLEYKRLSPNESLAKIKDTTNNTKFGDIVIVLSIDLR